MKSNKKIIKAIMCCCLTGVVLIGSAVAFLYATDSRTNRLTDGNLTLTITEENWSDVNANDLAPTQIVSKDPKIRNNIEDISAWVSLSVKIPSTNTKYDIGSEAPVNIGADGTVLNETAVGSYYDLFTYQVNSDWHLVAIDATHRNTNAGYTIYYYVYDKVLDADKETETPVFSSIQLSNIAIKPKTATSSIAVKGYGIQTSGIDDAYQAWAIFANQNSMNTEISYYNSHYTIINKDDSSKIETIYTK